MNRWKIFSMMICMIMLVGLLAACSEESSGEDGSSESGDAKEISFHLNASKKPGDEMYIEEFEKLSGYDLNYEFVNPADYATKLPVLFASGELHDVIQTGSIKSSAHEGALENGIFKELGPLLEEHGQNILENIPEEVWNSPRISQDGKIYAIPTLVGPTNTMATYIRKDWLDKLGMDIPETLDDWLAYFEGVKTEDMNGNGDPDDEYGYYLRGAQAYNKLFFGSFGVDPQAWKMTDGQMVPDMITDDMKSAIEFYRDLYSEGYINPDMFTKETQDWGNGILAGEAGSYTYLVQGYKTYGNPDEFSEEGAEIELINPAVGPDGESGLGLQSEGINSVLVIPEETENAEEIIKFFDWAWSSEEAENFVSFGIEGHNYTVEDGEVNYDESAPENAENFMSSLFTVYMNPRGDSRLTPKVLDVVENGDVIQEALQVAEENSLQNDAMSMPYLDAYSAAPELVPGLSDGTLFLQMFAKVVTGEADLDTEFDKFVEEWKKRGGDDAIQEATDWYNEFYNE